MLLMVRRLLLHDLVHDEGDGAVAGYIAGGAEAVHGYVESDHKCLRLLVVLMMLLSVS